MILRTNNALENNEELKLSLQEKYQYILVDEYQDTNGAQDKLLDLLADNPVNEGKPNLMVVGDDDQAIYRFQGANSSVMLDFIKKWSPSKIVLTDSYRSGQSILDLARAVIVNADNRLENEDSQLDKMLLSRSSSKTTTISELVSESEASNYLNIATEIKKLINNGQDPSSIAVLAPKHRYLEELAPFLLQLKLPINYERREQVLKQPRIVEIIDLVQLILAASKFNTTKIESLLPKILASEYWQISADEFWKIAIDAQKNQTGWLKTLESSSENMLSKFCEVIKVLAKDAKNQPFELILAYLTGSKAITLDSGKLWNLPWRDYYFSEDRLISDTADYINFMSQLDALKRAFNEWQPSINRTSNIEDFINFVSLFKKANIMLSDSNPYITSKSAINLMTAFKAKGLEWDTVFVMNIQEDVWGTKARSRHQTFSLPTSLKWIEPAADSNNDLIRLFYVGLTRAKTNLYFTTYTAKNSGQPSEKLSWLEDIKLSQKLSTSQPLDLVAESYQMSWQDKYESPTEELTILLRPVLENYKLSSTHLNDFLAVDKGGPKQFLFKHILKVPDELNPNAIYGDAIHKTLEYIHKQLSSLNTLPDISSIKTFFIDRISSQPLTKDELRFLKKRGQDNLSSWVSQNKSKFKPTDISEHNFTSEQITIESAKLTGKVDVIRKTENGELLVIDYKTSSPLNNWTNLTSTSAIRSDSYKKQLLFYKLLVDNSTFLGGKQVVNRGIIEFINPNEDNKYVELSYEYEESELKRLTKLINVVWSKIISLDFPDTTNYPTNLKGIKSFEEDLLNGKI